MNERKQIIPAELAERLADHFAAKGYNSVYTTVYKDGKPVMYRRPGEERDSFMPAHDFEDLSAFGPLPEHWTINVQDVLSAREKARYRADLRAKIESFETSEAIRTRLLAAWEREERGLREPSHSDMRFFCEAAKRTTDQYGKARKPYAPAGACPLRLKLSKAVLAIHTQEAYADHATYLVPVEGDHAAADLDACRRNLGAFVRYADSHTGFAGSGSNWTADLIVTERGAFAAISCRASIAD